MKKLLFLLAVILMHSHMASAASNNFLNKDWWKTATLEDVKKELKNGANVNAASDEDTTALMHAAIFNQNPEVIETLIDKGANVNAKNKDGSTALTKAAFNPNPEVIKTLIDEGADINAKNKDGYTALMQVALFNQNPELIKILINAGADVNAKNKYGYTALIQAALFNQNPEVIKILINAGTDVNAKSKSGSTALMFAASSQKNPDAVKALLKAGADANVIDNDGNIAAVFAALNKNPEIHSLILQAMDIEGYCKLTKNNSFDIGLCIDEMKVYAQKEYMLPDCTSNMPAMLYLTPIINAFANNAPNERKIIGWLTLAESAKRFNCSLGKTMYITMGGEDINKEMEEGMKEVQQITK